MQCVEVVDGKLVLGIRPKPVPTGREVLIRAYASAVNRADILQRKGAYPPPAGTTDIIGLEVSGVVEAVGSECSTGVSVGDRVCALLKGGGYAEYVLSDERHLLAVPASMTLSEAAAIPEAWLTAFQLLHLNANIQANERVLVHAGASGVGTAAVQLIKLFGSKAYVTVGSADKQAQLVELGVEGAINYKEGPWLPKLLEATQGEGVDIIMDCIGKDYVDANADALRLDGRWILYGLMSGPDVSGPFLRKLMAKRISLLASTLRTRTDEYKGHLVARFKELVYQQLFLDRTLKTVVSQSFALAEAQAAHDFVEASANTGKVLLVIRDESA